MREDKFIVASIVLASFIGIVLVRGNAPLETFFHDMALTAMGCLCGIIRTQQTNHSEFDPTKEKKNNDI